ncbi:MAG: hypothetical protein CMJ47_03720 [Planctomyces sp.]|nr:hypothetical protein [Planctomyces sp.]
MGYFKLSLLVEQIVTESGACEMRLTIFFMGSLTDATTGHAVEASSDLDGLPVSEDLLSDYLDPELADAGVIGGKIQLWVEGTNFGFRVHYGVPTGFSSEKISQLESYTSAQFDDGVGEGGFELDLAGRIAIATADTDAVLRRELHDDGCAASKVSFVAISARDGNTSLWEELLEAGEPVDGMHQGYTALHLAILYGHSECAKLLLAANANPNTEDLHGMTPLQLTALSNSLDDEASRSLTRLLLNFGADASHCNAEGGSARSYAVLRGKSKTATLYE